MDNNKSAGVWAKATDRLPIINGAYYIRIRGKIENTRDVAAFKNNWFFSFEFETAYPKEVEWLDESPVPQSIKEGEQDFGPSVQQSEESTVAMLRSSSANTIINDLKRMRDYFGEHDKHPFEHWAFGFLDCLCKMLNAEQELKKERRKDAAQSDGVDNQKQ
jgi:hypothetical protein